MEPRSPYHFTHHDPHVVMDGCPGCEIEKMVEFILRNCDPTDMEGEDIKKYWEWHKIKFPKNYT